MEHVLKNYKFTLVELSENQVAFYFFYGSGDQREKVGPMPDAIINTVSLDSIKECFEALYEKNIKSESLDNIEMYVDSNGIPHIK